MPLEYRYPLEEDHGMMHSRIEELKKMVKDKVPHLEMEGYNLLDHQDGRCDYDPYDRYDAEWHDEAQNFGHMYSEAVPSSYQGGEENLETPEDESDQEPYVYDDQDEYANYENPDDMPEDPPNDYYVGDDDYYGHQEYDDQYEPPQDDEYYDSEQDMYTDPPYYEDEQPDLEYDGSGYQDFETEEI